MRRRTGALLLVLFLLGCQAAPAERFGKLTLGQSRAEVEGLLGKPQVESGSMWEYHLTGGAYGWVVFDSDGRVTSWVREEAPGLRAGLLPLTKETFERLRLGTPSDVVLQFLGEPARREGDRWTYPAPKGYELVLRFSPEGRLVEKSFGRPKEETPPEAPASTQPPPAEPTSAGPVEPSQKAEPEVPPY